MKRHNRTVIVLFMVPFVFLSCQVPKKGHRKPATTENILGDAPPEGFAEGCSRKVYLWAKKNLQGTPSVVDLDKKNLGIKKYNEGKEELNSAANQSQRLGAYLNQVQGAKMALEAIGYTMDEPEASDDLMYVYAPILKAPEGTLGSSLINELIDAEKIKVAVGGEGGGVYIKEDKLLIISNRHALLSEEIISTTLLHESLHYCLTQKTRQGVKSLFGLEILRKNQDEHEPVTAIPDYTNYFNFQELATHVQDLSFFKQKVPHIKDMTGEEFLEGIKSRLKFMVKEIDLIFKTMKSENIEAATYTKILDGVGWMAHIPYSSPTTQKLALLELPILDVPGEGVSKDVFKSKVFQEIKRAEKEFKQFVLDFN